MLSARLAVARVLHVAHEQLAVRAVGAVQRERHEHLTRFGQLPLHDLFGAARVCGALCTRSLPGAVLIAGGLTREVRQFVRIGLARRSRVSVSRVRSMRRLLRLTGRTPPE